jgi:hypothetical protein
MTTTRALLPKSKKIGKKCPKSTGELYPTALTDRKTS